MSTRDRLTALLLAGILAAACGAERTSDTAQSPPAGADEPAAAETGPEATFAQGFDIHISDVVLGDPPGTIVFQKTAPIAFRYARRDGAAAEPVEVVVEAEMGAGGLVNTSAAATMGSGAEGDASAAIEEPLSLFLGVPGAEAEARVWLVSAVTGAAVSNTVTAPYRVVEAP